MIAKLARDDRALGSPPTGGAVAGEAYTSGMASLSDRCGRCEQEFPYALPICPTCHKSVCETCAVRMGGSVFCGTECAHGFFFGGQDDVEDESDLRLLEDEE